MEAFLRIGEEVENGIVRTSEENQLFVDELGLRGLLDIKRKQSFLGGGAVYVVSFTYAGKRLYEQLLAAVAPPEHS